MSSTPTDDQLSNSSTYGIAENPVISISRWPVMVIFALIFIICSTTAIIFIVQLYRKRPRKLESTPPQNKNENNCKMNVKKEKMPIYMFPDSTLFGDSQLLVQQKQEKRSVDEEAPRRSTREQTSEKTIKGPYKKRKKVVEDKIEQAQENQAVNEQAENVWTSLSDKGATKSASLSNE